MSDSATMNSPREAFRDGAHALLPSLVGALPFGLITGVAGTAAGLSPVETAGLSVFAFSGIAQLVVCQLLATASPAPVMLLAAVVVSLRFLMYSAALAPHLGHLPLRWKIALAYVTTDQGFASSVSHFQQSSGVTNREWYHLGGGIAQWVPWQITVAIGAVLGAHVPAHWSLDFAVPLTFLAMLIPAIKDRGTAIAASVAGVTTLGAVGLPFRLGLIVAALVGIAAGLFSTRLQDKGDGK